MDAIPTLIARGGRPSRWFVDIAGYGDNIPVLHQHLLSGLNYRQQCVYPANPKATLKKTALIDRLKEIKLVVITTDDISCEPWKRTGYVALFAIADIKVTVEEDGLTYLTFRLTNRLANLR